jgi:hypothetical protein
MPRGLDQDLHVQLSQEDKARFRALAERDGRTISSLARRVILLWIAKADRQSPKAAA